MCLNCGCGMPNDKMGDERNLTLEDLAEAQMANEGMTGEQTLEEMKKSLDKLKGEDIDKEVENLKAKAA